MAESGENCPKCNGLLCEDWTDPAVIKCVNCGREYDAPGATKPATKPYDQPALTEAEEVRAGVLEGLQAMADLYQPPEVEFWKRYVLSEDVSRMLNRQGRHIGEIRRALGITPWKTRAPGDAKTRQYLSIADAKRIIQHH